MPWARGQNQHLILQSSFVCKYFISSYLDYFLENIHTLTKEEQLSFHVVRPKVLCIRDGARVQSLGYHRNGYSDILSGKVCQTHSTL